MRFLQPWLCGARVGHAWMLVEFRDTLNASLAARGQRGVGPGEWGASTEPRVLSHTAPGQTGPRCPVKTVGVSRSPSRPDLGRCSVPPPPASPSWPPAVGSAPRVPSAAPRPLRGSLRLPAPSAADFPCSFEPLHLGLPTSGGSGDPAVRTLPAAPALSSSPALPHTHTQWPVSWDALPTTWSQTTPSGSFRFLPC